MAPQCAGVVECEEDDSTRPLPVIKQGRWGELLPYWLTRVTEALRRGRQDSAYVGLYDGATRVQ